MGRILSNDDYTIAWIAVLPIEAKAALGVLDKEHDGHFETVRGDDYIFIGGEINGHNVVVATWPTGQNYGVGSAAALANQVKARFQNIWFALLVGVAAGLPNIYPEPPAECRDIRLGDVLVCVPEKASTGIIHYDLGKDTENGFLLNGRLAETPSIVRTAIGDIKLRREKPFKAGNIFDKHLVAFQDKVGKDKFVCPSQEEDILFTTSREIASASDRIERLPRDESERTRVWYGSIGSGNSMMRNSRQRDMLRDKHNLIGLEMEAAGVVNILPTGVIRGVCDYGDGHKNKDWQPYAAAVAAVYAKGILYAFTPKARQVQTNDEVSKPCLYSALKEDLNSSLLPKEMLLIEKCLDPTSQRELFDKISVYDHERAHRRLRSKRIHGTGQWFLEHPKFQDWLHAKGSSSLWCSGIIGSGKTMIATSVVEAAKRNSATSRDITAYFYCEHDQRDMLKASDIFASLIKQVLVHLAATHRPCPPEVQEQIWKFFGREFTQPDFHDLYDIIISLSKNMIKIIYVIDGLDELDEKDTEILLRFAQKIFGSKAEQNGSRIAIFSREEIAPHLKVPLFIPDTVHISTSSSIPTDMPFYIKAVVEDKFSVCELNNDLALMEDIKKKLLEGASGMFLWVYLQVEALWDTYSSDGNMREAIEDLPRDLEETYRRCLQKIRHGRQYTTKVLKWVSYAARPLHINELREAVAFDLDEKTWDSDKVPKPAPLISCCANLIVLDATDQCVRFAHPSVEQFLKRHWGDDSYPTDPTQGVLSCGEFCVGYLSFSNFGLQIERNSDIRLPVMPQGLIATKGFSGISAIMFKLGRAIAPTAGQQNKPVSIRLPGKPTTTSNREQYKFLDYAVANWAVQTKMITRQSVVWDLFRQLAVNPNKSWNFYPWISSGQSQASHLHGLLGWAVKEQHIPLLEIVLALESRNSARNFFDAPVIGGSLPALHVASRLGFKDIVKLLLKVCAVNKTDGEGYTAMHHSAEKGYVEVARLLLDAKGAKVDIPSNDKRTPLTLAAIHGHEQIVSVLLGKQAKLERKEGDGRTPLYWGAMNGHEEVVKLLLDAKANIEAGYKNRTPLVLAAENGHERVVKLLLDAKANVEAGYKYTPLVLAAENGHEEVVKLLLDAKANVEAGYDYTPLVLAAENGHEGVVKLLLDAKANVEADYDYTPLVLAAKNGHEGVVKLLLDAKANVEAGDNDCAPLVFATKNGHEGIVKLLLDAKANIEVAGYENRTRLVLAAENDHEEVVKLLRDA